MDDRDLYAALPSAKQRAAEGVYGRAQNIAAELRAERERYESLCDAIQDAVESVEPTGYVAGGASVNRESALHNA